MIECDGWPRVPQRCSKHLAGGRVHEGDATLRIYAEMPSALDFRIRSKRSSATRARSVPMIAANSANPCQEAQDRRQPVFFNDRHLLQRSQVVVASKRICSAWRRKYSRSAAWSRNWLTKALAT